MMVWYVYSKPVQRFASSDIIWDMFDNIQILGVELPNERGRSACRVAPGNVDSGAHLQTSELEISIKNILKI